MTTLHALYGEYLTRAGQRLTPCDIFHDDPARCPDCGESAGGRAQPFDAFALAVEAGGHNPDQVSAAVFWERLDPAWLAGQPGQPFRDGEDALNATWCDLATRRGLLRAVES